MKKFYLLIAIALFGMGYVSAQDVCTSDPSKAYLTSNAGWTDSEWYQIINIDPQNLASLDMAKHTGLAPSGGTTTSTAFGSGTFMTPIMAYNETSSSYEPSTVNWPVNFYMTCIAADLYGSAYSKVELLGTAESGKADACYGNNNVAVTSPIWSKPGFFELSRQSADAVNAPNVSRHGYIELDDLPQVERVQWSFSSTAWKRGVKLDIKHGNGAWEPLRWEPSDISQSLTTFSEQGYAFEEIIGQQENPDSKISLRWRIWDGDSIHDNLVSPGTTYSTNNFPLAQKQVVRIHQIKIFSGVTPTSGPNGLSGANKSEFIVYRSGNQMVSTERGNFELYTPEGKLIHTAQGDRIELGNITKGIYILKMNSVNGNQKVQKVIL